MKKIIFVLLAFVSLSAAAEVIRMDMKNPQKNELFIDEYGKYRFRRAEDIFKNECGDSLVEEVRKKCLEAERERWARDKKPEEMNREGTLFTGKIQIPSGNGKDSYYYVNQGKKGDQIKLLLNHYYLENGLLYDIKTEEVISGDIVIGGVERPSSKNSQGERFIVQQNYEEGEPVGDPVIVPAK